MTHRTLEINKCFLLFSIHSINNNKNMRIQQILLYYFIIQETRTSVGPVCPAFGTCPQPLSWDNIYGLHRVTPVQEERRSVLGISSAARGPRLRLPLTHGPTLLLGRAWRERLRQSSSAPVIHRVSQVYFVYIVLYCIHPPRRRLSWRSAPAKSRSANTIPQALDTPPDVVGVCTRHYKHHVPLRRRIYNAAIFVVLLLPPHKVCSHALPPTLPCPPRTRARSRLS